MVFFSEDDEQDGLEESVWRLMMKRMHLEEEIDSGGVIISWHHL